jgi:hypothetical protein
MRKNIKKYFLLMSLVASGGAVFSQQNQNEFKPEFRKYILAGYNFGGTVPTPMPNTVRKINAWWPQFNPSLGYELDYVFNEKWGMGAALKIDYKGMGIKSEVMYMHTSVDIKQGDKPGKFEGLFVGHNKTIVNNGYLTLPIHAIYYPDKNWKTQLGVYFGYLFHAGFSGEVTDGYIRTPDATGEKIAIDTATFNFDNELRKFDCGLQAGAERRINNRISINGNLSWGLLSLFPKSFHGTDFSMYNVFFTLGISYKL